MDPRLTRVPGALLAARAQGHLWLVVASTPAINQDDRNVGTSCTLLESGTARVIKRLIGHSDWYLVEPCPTT